jgi:EAL domain-containing protein (putative c-di-GMP-specific phosphodiesterase class I)
MAHSGRSHRRRAVVLVAASGLVLAASAAQHRRAVAARARLNADADRAADPRRAAAIRDRLLLGSQLRAAVDLGQLRVVYQPIVSLATGTMAGVEALLRWDHPDRGVVAPNDFIGIAEENGTIESIGRWVLAEACRQATAWSPDVSAEPLFLCVNVSAREVQRGDFAAAVASTLEDSRLDPDRLRLEITETALLRATPQTISTLAALRRLGVQVAVDDFGIGAFPLGELGDVPVDTLKIAPELVRGPAGATEHQMSPKAGAIVAISDRLELTTVAEGIEDADQAARMRDLGCTYGQGYYFARPMAPEAIAPAAPATVTSIRRRRRSRSGGERGGPRGREAFVA